MSQQTGSRRALCQRDKAAGEHERSGQDRGNKRTGPDIIDLSIFPFRFLVGVDNFSSFFSFFSFIFTKRMMTYQHTANTAKHVDDSLQTY